jgi:hypothetical protein
MAILNILRTSGIFYNHLVHFTFIWYIFPVLVPCTKKNLATLVKSQIYDENVLPQRVGRVALQDFFICHAICLVLRRSDAELKVVGCQNFETS